jgi:very-short-patch-repair endonuclease
MRALPRNFNRRFVDAARAARMLGVMPHPAELTRRARSLRRGMTEAERRLWSLLRSRRLGGYKFVRQVPIGGFIADFGCREAGLVIEADGSQHDGSARDAIRDGVLRRAGYRILRFWNNDILLQPQIVTEAILAHLEGRE